MILFKSASYLGTTKFNIFISVFADGVEDVYDDVYDGVYDDYL